MDKEEAMKILKDFHDKSALFSVRTALDTIIPELKESEDEDERIRKELIGFLRNIPNSNYTCEEMALWLEKQGEERTVNYPIEGMFPYTDPADTLDGEIENIWNKLRNCDNTFTAAKSGFYEVIHHFATWLEKQGEQPRYSIGDVLCDKSCTTLNKDTQPNFEIVDIRDGMYICDKCSFPISQQDEYELVAKKIEPKFQNGQWIVWQNKCYKVNYNGCGYELIDQNDLSTSLEYVTVDTSASLWDIAKDAKDEDVLVYKDEISLYKHDIKNCTKQETTFGGFVYYCCYDGKRFITDSLYSLTEQDKMDIHPATKSQRDTLFSEMKEAGYEWSEETHELKKISQRMVSAEAKEALYDKPTDEEMKELLRTEYEKGRADTIAKMKSSWSEEDETNSCHLKTLFENLAKDIKHEFRIISDNDRDKYTAWLKSLKQKIGE